MIIEAMRFSDHRKDRPVRRALAYLIYFTHVQWAPSFDQDLPSTLVTMFQV
jgi:hypothetical protein